MCIAIVKPIGTRSLTDSEFSSCFSNNKDGIGYAFVAGKRKRDAQVIIKKFLDYDKFLIEYREDEVNNPKTPFLIHFRATSAGKTNLENCHPFSVNKHQAFIHNGTMFHVPITEDKSDTNLFNENIMKLLPKDWLDNDGIVQLVNKFIGVSRVAFLNSDKTFAIFGEKSGHWQDDIWFSNHDYKNPRKAIYTKYSNASFMRENYGDNYRYRDNNRPQLPLETKQVVARRTTVNGNTLTHTITYNDGNIITYTEPIHTKPEDKSSTFECEFCNKKFSMVEKKILKWGVEYAVCVECHEDFSYRT